MVNYDGENGLSVDNPLQVASDAAEGVQTAGINFINGDADTKAKMIIGGTVLAVQAIITLGIIR